MPHAAPTSPLTVTLADPFWAPRQAQARDHTLPVLLERMERAGVVDNFRRLLPGGDQPREGLHFTDSDLYKWMEAAAWAGRHDLLDPIIEIVAASARPDGYVHTFYEVGEGSFPRYTDLAFGHELYCCGHLIEAGLAHQQVTGSDALLSVGRAWADEVLGRFGPGRDERVDGHPEIELALARLAAATGEARYLDGARWFVERQLDLAGLDVTTVDLAGHAVKSLYLATAIAEIALATGDEACTAATGRLFATMVEQRSYPTGAVGGRWLDESVGKPFELPDAMSYAESCAAVAATRFSARVWDLTGDPRALDQIELLLYNAVPCGTGEDGETWFYAQPHAVATTDAETNPWAAFHEYQQQMLLQWFPARRHRWYPVTCCPPNLARMFATVDHHVAELADGGRRLLVHLPVASRIEGGGWDVEVVSGFPDGGRVEVVVHAAPDGGRVEVRRPGWAGGSGHAPIAPGEAVDLPVEPTWWESDPRVEGAAGTAFVRVGPVVHCVEGLDVPGVDLRDLLVDVSVAPADAFRVRTPGAHGPLHRPVPAAGPDGDALVPVAVTTRPYHSWANRDVTTMRYRFPRA